MRHHVRSLCIGLTVLVASVLVIWQFPSKDRAVRAVILELASSASFANEEPRKVGTRLEPALATHVTDPVSLDIAEVGAGNYARDELLAGYLAYATEFRKVEFRVTHVEVEWSPKHERATVRANLEVVLERANGSRHVEPRKLRCAIEHREGTWQLVYAQVTAKRVDEPEARP